MHDWRAELSEANNELAVKAKHGKTTFLYNLGCRCQPCKDYKSAYQKTRGGTRVRKRTRRGEGKVLAGIRHGRYSRGSSCYDVGCRCDEGKEAHRRYYAAYTKRVKKRLFHGQGGQASTKGVREDRVSGQEDRLWTLPAHQERATSGGPTLFTLIL